MIIGWYILGFDIPYMIARAKYGCNACCISEFDKRGFHKTKHAKEKKAIEDAEAKAEADAKAKWTYSDKRANEYPDLLEQLDDIYHNGIDGWKATIKAIKDKYPKS